MNIHDLGPLERAILKAITIGDVYDAPLALPAIWRLLPGYDTRLANVREALNEGGVLDGWVVRGRGHFALRDRPDLIEGLGTAQGRARVLWEDMKGVIRGMCKLPWIEAVAITGRPAWGVAAPGEDDVKLVVIAEGGRVRLARAGIAAYRKARGDAGARIRVETILDADALAKPAGTRHDALRWLSLGPVMNADGIAAFRAANPWIHVEFPSAVQDVAGGVPDYLVGAGRFDGRLARVRRSLVGGGGESDAVLPLFRSDARISGGLAALEETLQARLDGDGAECADRETSDAFEARFEPRWAAVEAWEVEGDPVTPLTPVDVAIEPVETPKRAKTAAKKAAAKKTPAKKAAAKKPAAKKAPTKGTKAAEKKAESTDEAPSEPPKRTSTRSRGATKRPSRRGSSASSETGRRTRGSRRK